MANSGVTAQGGPYAWGDSIKTSLHGRRCGLDMNDMSVGEYGSRDPIEVWTAGSTGTGSASTAILWPGGVSIMAATTASTFGLPSPSASYGGVGKTIQFQSTGGQNMSIILSSGNFQTSASSTYTTLTYTTTGNSLNGGVYMTCIPNTQLTGWVWALNGSTGAAGSGSTHLVFS